MKRLKDSNLWLLLISAAILAALIGLAVLGRNLYRAHYARQQVWPEFNPEDYALASISYHYQIPGSFGYHYADMHFLTEPAEVEALCRALNENHDKWIFHPMDNFPGEVYSIDLIPSSEVQGYPYETMDGVAINFRDGMALIEQGKFSGGFPVNPALEQILLDLYDAGLDSTCPAPTVQQLRGAAFSYLQRGKEVSSHAVAEEDLAALCDALTYMAAQAKFSDEILDTTYPTGLRLQLELEDIIFTLTFMPYRQGLYYVDTRSDRYNLGRYLLPEGCDPFAALGFPVQAPSAP